MQCADQNGDFSFHHGTAVDVFSRTANAWRLGQVVDTLVPGRVCIEYDIDGTPARKHLDLESPNFCLHPSVVSDSHEDFSDTLEERDPEFSCFGLFSQIPQLTAGVHILGKSVEPAESTADYEDVEDPSKHWKPSGKVIVPIADREIVYRHGADVAIKTTKDILVDEDFAGKVEELRIISEDDRERFEKFSCGLRGSARLSDLNALAELEANVQQSLGDGKGHLNFVFSLPFLHLKVREQGRFPQRPHVAEVIMGCVAQGEIRSAGKHSRGPDARIGAKLNSDSIEAELAAGYHKSEGPQRYDFSFKVKGGPPISIAQQKKTMSEVVKYLQAQWHEKAVTMPQKWKVLWVRVGESGGAIWNEAFRAPTCSIEPPLDQTQISIDMQEAEIGKGSDIVEMQCDQEEQLVLVYGDVGVGKSTLINELLGCSVAKAGKSSRGVTKEINGYPMSYNGLELWLVDVPGIGDRDRAVTAVLDEMSAQFEGRTFAALIVVVDGSSPRFTLGAQLIPRLFDLVFKRTASTHWCRRTIVVGTKFDKVDVAEHQENFAELCNIASEISNIVGADPIPENQIIAKAKGKVEDILHCLECVLRHPTTEMSFVKPNQQALLDTFLNLHAHDGWSVEDLRIKFEEDWQEPRRQDRLKRLQDAQDCGNVYDLDRALVDIDDIFNGDIAEEHRAFLNKSKAIADEWRVQLQEANQILRDMISTKDFARLSELEEKASDVPFKLHEGFQDLLTAAVSKRANPEQIKYIHVGGGGYSGGYGGGFGGGGRRRRRGRGKNGIPSCWECGKTFGSSRALSDHRRDTGH